MDDIPWIPLAMVVIAFLSWLRNQITEASEIRRARNAEKAEAARARRTTAPAQPAYETPYRDEPVRRAPAREVAEEVPKTFRELFEAINAQKEVATAASPPPLPPPVTRTEPEPEPEEEAWGDGDGFGGIPAVPQITKVAPLMAKRSTKKPKHSLAETLSDGDRLSNALILREILGPPKALRGRARRQ